MTLWCTKRSYFGDTGRLLSQILSEGGLVNDSICALQTLEFNVSIRVERRCNRGNKICLLVSRYYEDDFER